MTDKQIITILECCASNENIECCKKCVLCEKYDCYSEISRNALDLINRQRTEIERLEDELQQSEQCADIIETMLEEKDKDISDLIFKERSNAILEFAEALKQEADSYVTVDEIDSLVKEMMEVEE